MLGISKREPKICAGQEILGQAERGEAARDTYEAAKIEEWPRQIVTWDRYTRGCDEDKEEQTTENKSEFGDNREVQETPTLEVEKPGPHSSYPHQHHYTGT